MIRRENFGGIAFHEPTHKIYTLDKPSFRLIELFFISAMEIQKIQNSLKNEFDINFTVQQIEEFVEKTQKLLGKSLSQQRGIIADAIWNKEWSRQYFSAPISNFWSFTNLCNLHCTHCAWNSSRPLPGELNTLQCKKLIDEMLEMGVCELSFSGGEPLTKKVQLLEMASYAKKLCFHLGLATNATLINDTVAEELLNSGFDEMQVSFEGLESHEVIRGKGIWDKTIAGIRVLKKYGVEITFSTTINKTNLNELETIFEVAKKEEVKNIRFVRFIPIGRGKTNIGQFELSADEEIKLAETLWQKRWELFPETILTFNKHYVSIGLLKDPKPLKETKMFAWNWDCPSGRSRICIMPEGKVAPCPLIGSLGLYGGDVTKESLKEIWENSDFFNLIRTDKRQHDSKCQTCNLWTSCSGGCKAASYAQQGKLMAEDPLCLDKLISAKEVNHGQICNTDNVAH